MPQKETPVERVVLLSEDGHPVGTAAKAQVHTTDTPLHLAFSCYVFDDDRRLLLTRRAESKPTWPGVWTNSCCGHPAPGEVLTDAVARRLTTELGIWPNDITLLLPDFRYRAVMDNGIVENELCPVFRAHVDTGTEPRPAADEVSDCQWVPWDRFAGQVLRGDIDVSPWSRLQVQQLVLLGPDPLAWTAPPVRTDHGAGAAGDVSGPSRLLDEAYPAG